jgi:hypothetical protein
MFAVIAAILVQALAFGFTLGLFQVAAHGDERL